MERERKMFWVIHNHTIRKLEGLICENATGHWFIPKIGCTCCEGFHLFDSFDMAKKMLLFKIEKDISELQKLQNTAREMTEPDGEN